MTRALRAERVDPQDSPARGAVVLLHGYGANGRDLIGLAEPLAPLLPGVLFVAPDAPEPCRAAPMGLQWYPIPWIDGSPEGAARTAAGLAARDLDAFLDALLRDEGLRPSQVALLGFSQGAMMALHVAPRRAEPLAGVVAISGMLVDPELLAAEARSRPPVLLLHGDRDDVVPFAAMDAAARALRGAGWDAVGLHRMRGTGHGIAPEGLGAALAFLRERLGGG